jgi:hypothetical protein
MIQKFLTKYWLSFHLVVLFVAVSLALFSTEKTGAAYFFWLSLFGIEALLLLPTVFKGESIAEARKRVFRALESDPFTYVGLILVGGVCIQWLNSGCTLVYFPDADIWKFSMPPVEWLPYSVQPLPSFALLSLVVAVYAGGLIIRNGLGRGGRRFFLDWASIISGILAVYAVFKSYVGISPYAEWAAKPGACNIGSFFAFWFLIALGRDLTSLRSSSSILSLKSAFWWVFAFVGNLAGFLQFATAISVLIYFGVGIVLILYRVGMLSRQRVSFSKQFRFVAGILFSLALIGSTVLFLFPSSPVKPKVRQVANESFWSDFATSRDFRMDAALKIWEDVPWTGTGPKGFSHYLGTVIEDSDWKYVKEDKQFVWNDAFQFLCEWGVIGIGTLMAIIITMLIPFFVRMRHLFTRRGGSTSVWEIFISFDAYLVPSVVAILLLVVEGWFFSPFQSPATFLSWFCVLALLPGLLPKQKTKKI